MDGHNLHVAVDGRPYTILPEEVEVRAEARSGYAVASEGAYLAALQTELTHDLVLEGLAREFVRHVQEMRKQLGLDIADRIHLQVDASPDLEQAIVAHRPYIMGEILALSLNQMTSSKEPDLHTAELELDGEQAVVGMRKAT